MAKKFILGALLALGVFVLIAPQCRAQASLDAYGGLNTAPCTNATGHYTLVTVGGHWWFCTPTGHIEFSVQNNVIGSNSANNQGHASSGGGYDCQTNSTNSLGTNLAWVNQGPTYPSTYMACINLSGGSGAPAWTPFAGFQDGMGMCCGTPPAGSTLKQESTISAVNATAGSWFYDRAGNLYAHTTTGDSPANHTYMNFPQDSYYSTLTTKYLDPQYDWAWQVERRLQHWSFNTVAQDSVGYVEPSATCSSCDWPNHTNPIPMPLIVVLRPVQHSASNRGSYVSSPVKSISAGDNTNYGTTAKNWLVDAFDPDFSAYWNKMIGTETGWQTELRANYAYMQAFFTDDSDQFYGSGAGPDFLANSQNNPNAGRMAIITAPQQVYNPANGDTTSAPVLYADPKVYSKAQANNPASCSISSPCSVRDYIAVEYSDAQGPNIAKLNNAWGSNYTSFDSTGTQVTGETISANGSATSYTYTLAHNPVSPFSVGIYVGGVLKAGDCPSFQRSSGNSSTVSCRVKTSSGSGSIESPTSGYLTSASNINYSTGVVTLTFASAPNAAITVNYVYAGWMAGGTGLMDEDGTNPWIGANAFCLEGANPSYPNSFICSQSGGNYKGLPNEAFHINSTGIVVSGTLETVNITPAVAGGYTLANGQNVYITGSSVAACNGGPFVINDGGTTSTSFTITAPAGCTNATGGWVSSAVAYDLDHWIAEYSAEYHKVIRAGLNAATNPNLTTDIKIPWFGLDDTGSWSAPPISYFLQGAAPYVDGVEMGTFDSSLPSSSDATNIWQYWTEYLGDKPIMNQAQVEAESASPLSCHSPSVSYGMSATQSDRGLRYYNTLNFLLNTAGFNGTKPFVGMNFWLWADYQNLNQGLVTIHDNAYDGVEDVTGYSAAACENTANGGYYITTAGYKCGGEEANFGNLLTGATGVVAANQLWIQAVSPGTAQFSASPDPVAFGNVPINTTSPAQTVSITNPATLGGSNLTIGALSTVSPLAISNDLCSNTSVAPQASCTYQLSVTPTAVGTGSGTVTVPDDAGNPDSVGANWTGTQTISNFTLSVAQAGTGSGTETSTDGQINCGSVCSFSYASGSQVILNASPASGSAFIGWSGGGCSGTGSCVVTVTANITVTATFNQSTPRGRAKKLIF